MILNKLQKEQPPPVMMAA
jgi:hypothetical protein